MTDAPASSGPEFTTLHDESGAPDTVSGNAHRNNAGHKPANPNLANLAAQLTGVERRLKSTLSRLQRITRKVSRSASTANYASTEPAPVLEIMLNGVCRARLELPDVARISGSRMDLTGKNQHL